MYRVGEIKRFREWLKMSRQEFAERLGYAASTLGRWERGQNDPRAHDLAVIHEFATQSGFDIKFFESYASVKIMSKNS